MSLRDTVDNVRRMMRGTRTGTEHALETGRERAEQAKVVAKGFIGRVQYVIGSIVSSLPRIFIAVHRRFRDYGAEVPIERGSLAGLNSMSPLASIWVGLISLAAVPADIRRGLFGTKNRAMTNHFRTGEPCCRESIEEMILRIHELPWQEVQEEALDWLHSQRTSFSNCDCRGFRIEQSRDRNWFVIRYAGGRFAVTLDSRDQPLGQPVRFEGNRSTTCDVAWVARGIRIQIAGGPNGANLIQDTLINKKGGIEVRIPHPDAQEAVAAAA